MKKSTVMFATIFLVFFVAAVMLVNSSTDLPTRDISATISPQYPRTGEPVQVTIINRPTDSKILLQTPTRTLRLMTADTAQYTPTESGTHTIIIQDKPSGITLFETTFAVSFSDNGINASNHDATTVSNITSNNTSNDTAINETNNNENATGLNTTQTSTGGYVENKNIFPQTSTLTNNQSSNRDQGQNSTHRLRGPPVKRQSREEIIDRIARVKQASIYAQQDYSNDEMPLQQTNPALVVFDSEGRGAIARVDIQHDNSKFSTSTNSQTAVPKISDANVMIDFGERHVRRIRFNNTNITEGLTLGIEDIYEGKIDSAPQKKWTSAYAVDPSNMQFSEGMLTAIATGTELYKCKEWDFYVQQCNGEWTKIADLTPGEEYNVTLTATDPGFAEATISTGVSLPLSVSDITVSGSIPSPFETVQGEWGVTVFNPTNQTINVSKITMWSTSNIMSTAAGVSPPTGWTAAANLITWSGSVIIGPVSAQDFIATVGSASSNLYNSVVRVNATTNVSNVSINGYITGSRNGNAESPSLYFLNDSGSPAYVAKDLLPNQSNQFIIRVDNAPGVAALPLNTQLVFYLPVGWTNVIIPPQTGWNTNASIGDDGSGEIITARVATSTIAAGAMRNFTFNATAPDLDAPQVYQPYGMLLGAAASSSMAISSSFVPAFVSENTTRLLDVEDDRFTITRTAGGSLYTDQYLTIPGPTGSTGNNIWGVTVVNPTDNEFNVTQIDVVSDINFFNGITGVTPATGWSAISQANLRWTGNRGIPAHDVGEFLFGTKSIGTINARAAITATTNTTNGTLITTGFLSSTRSTAAIQYPAMYAINDSNGTALAIRALTPGIAEQFTIRINNTGAGALIPTATAFEIHLPPGWTNITALSQTGWTILQVRSDPHSGGMIRAMTATTTIAINATRDFVFNATPPDGGTNSTYRFDAWLIGPTATVATQILQSMMQLAVTVAPSNYGIDITRKSDAFSNLRNTSALFIEDIVKAQTPTSFNFSILNVRTNLFETLIEREMDESKSSWNVTLNINQTFDPRDYINDTIGENYGRVTIRWITNSGNNTALYEDRIIINQTLDITNPHASLSYPEDDMMSNKSAVTLSYDAGDNVGIRNCSISIDGITNSTNTTTANGTRQTTISFADGPHNWSVACEDLVGNKNMTAQRNFTIDTTQPSVFNISSPQNNTYSTQTTPELRWEQTTDIHFAEYTILIGRAPDFSSFDHSYTTSPETNNMTTTDQLFGNAEYYWRVIARDSFGNSRNSTDIFTYTTDTIAPDITLNAPISVTLTNNTVAFNFTPIDTNLKNCTLYGNFPGIFGANSTNATPENNANNIMTLDISDGQYLWNVICYDKAGTGRFSTANESFTIDTIPPIINIEDPINDAYENVTNNIVFFYNTSDETSSVASCSFILDDVVLTPPRYTPPQRTSINFTKFIDNGQHSWSINCTDTNGLTNSSEVRSIRVNVTGETDPPIIGVNSPIQDATIPENNITFNFTVDDSSGIENCSLIFDEIRNQTNYTVANHAENMFSLIDVAEGTHNWTIDCYDNLTFARKLLPSRNITIDMTNPTVVLNNPQENIFSTTNTVEFNYTPTDANLQNCTIYTDISGPFNAMDVNTSVSSGVMSTFIENVADGNYSWSVLCYDRAGRIGSSVNRSALIDANTPRFDFTVRTPMSPAAYDPNTNYTFNITIDDAFIDTVLFENNFTGIMINHTVLIRNGNTYTYNITGVGASSYSYKWNINDSLGRSNSSNWNDYDITQVAPILVVLLNGSAINISTHENAMVNITAKLTPPAYGIIELYVNSVLYANESSPLVNRTTLLNPGTYNITAIFTSTGNYSATTTTNYIIVNDSIQPTITLISPAASSTAGTSNVNFQYNISDYSTINNCSIYINGTLTASEFNPQKDTTLTFGVTLADGTYNWRIGCYDSSRNSNTSSTRTVTVIDSTMIKSTVSTSQSAYEVGSIIIIATNTSDRFSIPLNTTVTTDIIRGNTTLSWWNSSWKERKQLKITNRLSVPTYGSIVIANISGLSGNISNCAELRIVKNESNNHTLIANDILGGNDDTYCIVRFAVDAGANAVNETNYYAYYNNTGVGVGQPAVLMLVQHGDVSGTGTSFTKALQNPVDMNKSFILFTANANNNGGAASQYTPSFVNSTNVRFSAYASATSVVAFEVIQHPAISVQRNEESLIAAAMAVNVTIQPVNTSESFIIIYGRVNSATAGQNNMGFFTGRFLNSTAITLERQTNGSAAIVSWQVVSWHGARVRSNNVTFSNLNATSDFAAINSTKSMLFFSKAINGSTAIDGNHIRGELTNDSRVTFYRVSANGTVEIDYFVVELSEPPTKQNKSISIAADTNVAISAVELNRSIQWASWTTSGATTTYQNGFVKTNFTNTVNMRLDKQSAAGTNIVNWHVIQFSNNETTATTGIGESFVQISVNETGIDGNLGVEFNTTHLQLGNYSAISRSAQNGFASTANGTVFQILADTTPPLVNATSPLNASWSAGIPTLFSFSAYDLNLANCTLWHNASGTYSINSSNTSLNNNMNMTSTLSTSIHDGILLWGISCSDEYGNVNSTINRTIYIDNTPPAIALNMPGNNSNMTNIVLFNWTADDNLAPNMNCYISAANMTSENITSYNSNGTTLNTTIDVGGMITWNVTCSDLANNTNTSINKYFFSLLAPTSLAARINSTGFTITWTAVPGVDNYSIYISDNYNSRSALPNVTVTQLNYTDLSASNATQRYYWISANRANAESLQIQSIGKYNVQLTQNMTLISLPFSPENLWLKNNTNDGYDLSAGNCVKTLWRWNGTRYLRTDWNGSVFLPSFGSQAFVTINTTQGYWLETNATCNVTYFGTVAIANTTIPLRANMNLVSWNSPLNQSLPQNYDPPLIRTTPNNSVQTIDRYNPETRTFEATAHYVIGGVSWGWFPSFDNPDFLTLDPGRGYFFDAMQTANWTFDPRTT